MSNDAQDTSNCSPPAFAAPFAPTSSSLAASAPGTTVIARSTAANALSGSGSDVQQMTWMSSPATAFHAASATLNVNRFQFEASGLYGQSHRFLKGAVRLPGILQIVERYRPGVQQLFERFLTSYVHISRLPRP